MPPKIRPIDTPDAIAIETITTPFIWRITVNCYLVRTYNGFVLIDTASAASRRSIEQALEYAGCKPDNLKLIILTHGDFDHCGNAAFLRQKYNTRVLMHEADTGMVERGDMFWNRKSANAILKMLAGMIFRLSPSNRFKPDNYIKAGDHLADFGFDAEVIELPGHSSGSIGLLTPQGDLFCGDLLANMPNPDVWTIIDDREAARASVAKIQALAARKPIHTVYPGHGHPFPLDTFLINLRTPGCAPQYEKLQIRAKDGSPLNDPR